MMRLLDRLNTLHAAGGAHLAQRDRSVPALNHYSAAGGSVAALVSGAAGGSCAGTVSPSIHGRTPTVGEATSSRAVGAVPLGVRASGRADVLTRLLACMRFRENAFDQMARTTSGE